MGVQPLLNHLLYTSCFEYVVFSAIFLTLCCILNTTFRNPVDTFVLNMVLLRPEAVPTKRAEISTNALHLSYTLTLLLVFMLSMRNIYSTIELSM